MALHDLLWAAPTTLGCAAAWAATARVVARDGLGHRTPPDGRDWSAGTTVEPVR